MKLTSFGKFNNSRLVIKISILSLVLNLSVAFGSVAQALLDTLRTNPYSLADARDDLTIPCFVDLDNDGDLDIMVGSTFGRFDYYENIGSSTAPDYAPRLNNPFSIVTISDRSASPAFADLDNDGDMDMLSGSYQSGFFYFENIGSSQTPNFGSAVINPFSLISPGNQTSPVFIDLDGDLDLDILCGRDNGSFQYFENIGTIAVPLYSAPVANPFSLVNTFPYSIPEFRDFDIDGDMDLLAGCTNGNFYYFENIGTSVSPNFTAAVANPFGLTDTGNYSSPTVADLDGDGDWDLLSGDFFKRLYYFENTELPVTIVWDGETSTNWTEPTNWVGDQLPTNQNRVIISFTTRFAKYPIISSAVDVSKIEIDEQISLNISEGSLKVQHLVNAGEINVSSESDLALTGTERGPGTVTILRNTTFDDLTGRYSIVGSPISSATTDVLGSLVYSYDATVPYASDGANRFNEITTPVGMTAGDGYFSAFTGTLIFAGIPNTGTISKNLVYDEINDGGSVNAGYNLVSNPYAAAISYTSFALANPDINGTIYLWDDGGSNAGQRANSDYITVTGVGAAGGSSRAASWDGNIRSCQGFFVKATTGGTLNFTTSMMTTGNNTDNGFFRKENSEPEVLRLSLSSNSGYNDILIGFSEDATEGFDRMLDAFKIKGNSDLQLYSRMGEDIMAIQALPNLIKEITIDLGFDAVEAGHYIFNISDLSLDGFNIYLEDHLLGHAENLSKTGTYSFETSTVNDSDRFSLVFSSNNVLAFENRIEKGGLNVYTKGDELHVNDANITDAKVKIYDLSGATLYEFDQVRFEEGRWSSSFSEKGLLIITIETGDQLLTKKFWK